MKHAQALFKSNSGAPAVTLLLLYGKGTLSIQDLCTYDRHTPLFELEVFIPVLH